MEKQRKTFLSYSRVNKNFAVRLARELKAEGFDIWLDQLDIPPGARWDDELEHALETCEVFMIILTPASMASDNVKDEMGYAIDTGKRVLPVLLENAAIPLRLRRFQYVDFTDKSFDEGVESAKELLRSLIDQPTIPRRDVPSAAQVQAEADRRTHEEGERIAAQKAESESQVKEETDSLAKQRANEEFAAQAKAESERKAKAEATRLAGQKAEAERKAKEKAELVTTAPAQQKPISKGLVISIVATIGIVVCVIAGFAINALMNRAAPAATAERLVSAVTEVNPANSPEPTDTARPVPTSSPTPIPNFILLSTSETSDLYANDQGKGIFVIASEQHSDTELQAFFNENQPIPVTLDNSMPTLIGNGWCATTETILMGNFKYLEIVVLIDGARIPEDQFAEIRFTNTLPDGRQGECMRKVIAVDQWASGEHTVQQEWNITKSINDGMDDYDPQNLSTFNYVVTVP